MARRSPEGRQRRRRRGGREPGSLRRGAHPRRGQAALAGRPPGPRRARPGRQADLRAPDGRARNLQRHHGRAVRRQEQLVRGLRLLVPEDLRPRGRAPARRRPPEVDGRRPRADGRDASARAGGVQRDRARRVDPHLSRRRQGGDRRADEGARRRPQPAGVRRRSDRAARVRAGGSAASGAHPDGRLDPVGDCRARRRHVQGRRGAARALREQTDHAGEGGHRVLPDRRAERPYVVRPPGIARLREGEELRRLVDRVGEPRGRANRKGLKAPRTNRGGSFPLKVRSTSAAHLLLSPDRAAASVAAFFCAEAGIPPTAETSVDEEETSAYSSANRIEGVMDLEATGVKLTDLASCGGCAAKYSAARLEELLAGFVPVDAENLLVGLAPADDAAVYRLDDERALIFTLDFFPPVVDDPGDYGAIAATNALNDVFAMGGAPLLALSIAAFPEELPMEMLGEIFAAADAQVRAAGGLLAGGHTI